MPYSLVSTHWVTSNGLAVLADPDTPYLHVGRGLHSSTLQLNSSRYGHTSPCPHV
jgi:hypothetical protein